MATSSPPLVRRGRAVRPFIAIGAVVALVVGAVLVRGYDARDVPPLETAVWVTRANGQYARVNTELAAIDTVRAVSDPVGIVQSGSAAMILSQGYSQAWPVNPAYPVDLGEGTGSGLTASQTPAGTTTVATAGSFIAYLTFLGEVHLGAYPEPGAAGTGAWKLDPYAGLETDDEDEQARYLASAVALDASGTVVIYSAQEGAVRRYDAMRGAFVGDSESVPRAPDGELAMSLVDGRWVLYSASEGLMWIQGADAPVAVEPQAGSVLQGTASTDGVAYVADGAGLLAVTLADRSVQRVAQASGTPAAPVTVDGATYAGWLSQAQASLWSSATGTVGALTVPTGALADVQNLRPSFQTNGSRAVFSEYSTGLVWTVPGGTLIPLADWDPLDDVDELQGTVEVDDVVEQAPPVAVADSFGVRRGAVVRLPLLYNDHDPNRKDALSIAPESITGWDASGFGSLGLADNDQAAVAHIAAESGTATFTYAVTDGVNTSAPAAVTVTVVPPEQNSPPEWCGVEDCVQVWPVPEITPGGFVEVPVLDGWVDPESDVIALVSAVSQDLTVPLTVVATAEGTVAIRHLDPNASAGAIDIDVTVADSFGATATKTLTVRVAATPALTAPPIVLTAGVSDPRQVAIADHVTGGSGSYRLVDAVVTQGEESFTVTPVSANGTIELVASEPGQYVATYTIEDAVTLAQQTAVLRFTVANSARPLTLPPLTAFVRPLEDATLDVLAAVQNTTGRVLLLSSATSSEPNLSASIVAETFLRVSGTTATGEPGHIGVVDVVVSDGAGGTATGQVTVFLLPPNPNERPIAVPDAISVRAGTQVDIPVLVNDISPQGEQILLHPSVEGSGTEGELAFASGAALRYVAPAQPGVYTLYYTTYLESNPERFDTAAVTVTVVPLGSNRAPEPPVLIGRVVAGQTVRIPFNRAGVDPDGDDVALVDVSALPAGSGVASVSAAGGAILYTAPAAGVPGGQVTFTYTVKDARGEVGKAEVRVGVLPTEVADVAPVTYSDYVGAQVSSRTPVTVTPLDNDRDPLRGLLRLVRVEPNATPGTPEYERLAALIDSTTSLEDGRVVLRGGDVRGTHSYIYTVESSTSLSTAQGLIVVGVSEELGPSQLTVSDTTVTARTRLDLAEGIDVVSGKVRWQTGDPGSLTLSLVGPLANTYSVSGWKISGPTPRERTIVPFSLTGTDFAGNPVQTYGFLRIPAFEDMRLQAVSGLSPIQVGEEQSVALTIAELVDAAPGDVVELRQEGGFPTQRANARCTPSGGDRATYQAGREAPWSDSCALAVRIAGQDTWSIVAVPLSIIPKDPQAILNPVSRTISPGDIDSVNLKDAMVTWEGGRVGDLAGLRLDTSYTGANFIVTTEGGTVTVQAVANAKPGVRERIDVSSPDYGGLNATITLVVGAAHPDAPRGANFSYQCDVSRGNSCTITAIGLAGEYDPFAGIQGGGLKISNVGATGSVACPVATITQASPTTLVATWPNQPRPVGGECAVPFTVMDAQGRTGPGQLSLDVLGYPQTPSSVTTVAYTGNSVTLQVALGPAVDAHPAVTAVAIYRADAAVPAACAPSNPGQYRCVISGLVNGERAFYTARAVNSVGESLDTSAHESWAYQAPVITSLTATSPYAPGTTTQSTGSVALTIESGDDTQSFTLTETGATISRTGPVTNFTTSMPVGPTVLQVTPISKFTPPIPGGNSGAVSTVAVTVVGSPYYSGAPTATPTGTSITLSGVTLNANYSPEPLSQRWVAWVSGGAAPTCTMSGSGQAELSGVGLTTSATSTVSGLNANTTYSIAVCGSNGYGATLSPIATAFTWVPPAAPTGNLTFTIASTPSTSGPVWTYGLVSGPAVTPLAGFTVYYWYNGTGKTTAFDVGFTSGVTITAAYCLTADATRCGDTATITPAPGSAPNKVRVEFPDMCVAVASPSDAVVTGASGAEYSVDPSSGTDYVLTWEPGPYSGLDTIVHPYTICPVDPEDPEDPEDP